jgi:TonB family protein
MALDVPAHVQARFDELSKNHPDKKYILLEMSGTHNDRLQELEKTYGLPSSVEVFKNGHQTLKGTSESGVVLERGRDSSGELEKSFVILEYNASAQTLSDLSNQDNVYTIVEKSASFPDGMPGLYNFLADQIEYPSEARKAGVEGKVFVEFIIETDGAISNVTIKKGVHQAIDAEAVRVMSLSPKWNPGTQKGVAVRQKLILPINFSLGNENELKKTSSLRDILTPIPPIRPKNDRC